MSDIYDKREIPADLQKYFVRAEIGLEPTPDEFVAALVEVFREVRRVLRNDGTVWLNLGDSYARTGGTDRKVSETAQVGSTRNTLVQMGDRASDASALGLKHKDLIGIPWRVAFALQADGWYLRQDIIWAKPNQMPESVRDRCTKAHEYVFLLTKSPRYYYDQQAIAEPAVNGGKEGVRVSSAYGNAGTGKPSTTPYGGNQKAQRNRRSVWSVATQPFDGAHFATMPPALAEPCILAGCPRKVCADCGAPWEDTIERTKSIACQGEGYTKGSGRNDSNGPGSYLGASARVVGIEPTCSCGTATTSGTVLDPFGGAGTTGLVAARHGRSAILCELNPEYAALAQRRISDEWREHVPGDDAWDFGPLFRGAAE